MTLVQKSSKLNSRPVYCSQIYGMLNLFQSAIGTLTSKQTLGLISIQVVALLILNGWPLRTSTIDVFFVTINVNGNLSSLTYFFANFEIEYLSNDTISHQGYQD